MYFWVKIQTFRLSQCSIKKCMLRQACLICSYLLKKNMQVLGKVLWKEYACITNVHVRERGTENALAFLCGFLFGNKFVKWYRNMMKINKGKKMRSNSNLKQIYSFLFIFINLNANISYRWQLIGARWYIWFWYMLEI